MHFLLEAFITPFTIVLLLKNIFPLGGNNNLGTIIVNAAMILIAGVSSFVQNIRTSDTVDNLLKMVSVTTNIKRDGEDQELPTDQVVVGDIINLSAGDMVPADMRLLRSKDLFCTTSSINGDYNPKEKIANKQPRFEKVNDYLDYPNILYEGTTIVSGSGVGVCLRPATILYLAELSNPSIKSSCVKILLTFLDPPKESARASLAKLKQHATSAVIMVSFVAGIIGMAIPYTATGQILQFTALPSEYLILVFALMIFYLLLTSLIKLIYLKHKKFLI